MKQKPTDTFLILILCTKKKLFRINYGQSKKKEENETKRDRIQRRIAENIVE